MTSWNVQAEILKLSDQTVIFDVQFLIFDFQVNGKDSAYALALANRSAVSMRLGKQGIKNALKDVDRAIKAGHPAPAKLWERKITCLRELGLFQEVLRNFDQISLRTSNKSMHIIVYHCLPESKCTEFFFTTVLNNQQFADQLKFHKAITKKEGL